MISTHEIVPPTHAEVESLYSIPGSSSCEPTGTTATPVDEVLRQGLSVICDNEWVSNFLFNEDINPLSVLLAPVNIQHATPCIFQRTSVQCDKNNMNNNNTGMHTTTTTTTSTATTTSNHLFDMQMVGDVVFIPAFSVDSTSVGFGVQHCSMLARSKWGYDASNENILRQFGHFKYVTSNENNHVIRIHEDMQCDVIRITTMTILKDNRRTSSMILLRRGLFHDLLSNHLNIFNVIKHSLLLFNFSSNCHPICPNHPHTHTCNCRDVNNCQVNLKPKHPYDFKVSNQNITVHFTPFQGLAMENHFQNGSLHLSMKMGTRISISKPYDNNLVDRLATWAIRDQMKNIHYDPVKFLLPTFSNHNGTNNNNNNINNENCNNNYEITNDDNINSHVLPPTKCIQPESTAAYHENKLVKQQTLVPPPPPPPPQQQQQPNIQVISNAASFMNNICDDGDNHIDNNHNNIHDFHNNSGNNSTINDSHDDNNSINNDNDIDDDENNNYNIQVQPGIDLGIGETELGTIPVNLNNTNICNDDRDEAAAQIEQEDVPFNFSIHDLQEISKSTVDRKRLVQMMNKKQSTPIQDKNYIQTHNAHNITNNNTMYDQQQQQHHHHHHQQQQQQQQMVCEQDRDSYLTCLKEIEKQKKMQCKKMRNREAARRSNLKRKLKDEAMKRELKVSKQRLSLLEQHEKKLREENLNLRKSLTTPNKLFT